MKTMQSYKTAALIFDRYRTVSLMADIDKSGREKLRWRLAEIDEKLSRLRQAQDRAP